MDYERIANEVEIKDFASSSVHMYMGGNVKSPGLVKGAWYIIKYWSSKSLPSGSENPYWVGQFLGAGEDHTKVFAETPRAKLMTGSQRYFFKRPNGEVIGAANFNGALVINGDDEQRITFYALHSEAQQGAMPLDAPTIRPDREHPTKPAQAPRGRPASVAAPIHKPAARAIKPRVQNESEGITDEMRALFRKSEPPVYRDVIVAQFLTEAEAKQFIPQTVDGYYVLDGFAHNVCAPEASNEPAQFTAKAKAKSSLSVFRQKIIQTLS